MEPENDDFSAEAKAVMSFDPFEGQGEGPSPSETPTEGEAAPEGGQPAEPGKTPEEGQGGEPQPAPQPAEESPELRALRAEFDAYKRGVESFQRQPAQPTEQPKQTNEPDPLPEYNFNIPQPLLDGLRSEDPAENMQAVQALVKGVAQTVHRTVRLELQSLRESMTSGLPQMVSSHIEQYNTGRQVYQDFYGTYPQYDKPELRPTVLAIAQEILQDRAARGLPVAWNADLKKQVGDRMATLFGQQNPIPAKPPASITPGSRPGVSSGDAQARDIADTLFG